MFDLSLSQAEVPGHHRIGEFLRHIVSRKAKGMIAQSSVAVLALAFIARVASALHLNLATVSLLFVMVIVLLARVGDFLPSVAVSFLAALGLAYMAPPEYSFRIDDPLDIVVAAVSFLIISLIIARLVFRLHKMSEEALASVNRKLIDAEERVRARIGQELHDDIEQRLAMLAVTMGYLNRNSSNLDDEMNRIREETSRISADLQALAYELRPYKLEYLGIATAVKTYCERFAVQHNVKIDFRCRDLPKAVPLGASLALVRVMQEALHNSAEHSGVRQFEVELFGASGIIQLAVHDSGVGFNPGTAIKGPGLGLRSMKERMKLVEGRCQIDSQPRKGTTIHASVQVCD